MEHTSTGSIMRMTFFFILWLRLAEISQGARFNKTGEMETELTGMMHVRGIGMDEHIPDNILLINGHSIETWSVQSGSSTINVAGQPTSVGYLEGEGNSALFWFPCSFSQPNATTILVADMHNHCLRLIDRFTRHTSTQVGLCQSLGDVDGGLRDARFNKPFGLIRANDGTFYLSDSYNSALKVIDIVHDTVVTLVKDTAELQKMRGIALSGSLIYLTFERTFSVYDLDTGTLSALINGASNEYLDGSFASAMFEHATTTFILVNKYQVLVADSQRLRLLDLDTAQVSTVCSGIESVIDGQSDYCQFDRQIHALLLNQGRMYIAQEKYIRTFGVISGKERDNLNTSATIWTESLTCRPSKNEPHITVAFRCAIKCLQTPTCLAWKHIAEEDTCYLEDTTLAGDFDVMSDCFH